VDLSGLPDDLPETLALARELDPSLRETAAFPMTGEVRVGIEGGSAAEERLRGVASALVERGGAVRVLHGPASLYRVARESLEDAGLGRLTAELRALFDPRKTLVWGSGGEG
jgi:hypothetical protein